ncbi:hypothetical protein BDZ94DRAFT_1276249 [Collybia nuda]|uniref:Uncharacterized protein n=1 Tax=Collybia nuda TaxID=64659 RepID=A0A9P5XV08_9AGAR|nr:hypothetical protein BDZ94DRAFT_1276249 [Collybia nuda]
MLITGRASDKKPTKRSHEHHEVKFEQRESPLQSSPILTKVRTSFFWRLHSLLVVTIFMISRLVFARFVSSGISRGHHNCYILARWKCFHVVWFSRFR